MAIEDPQSGHAAALTGAEGAVVDTSGAAESALAAGWSEAALAGQPIGSYLRQQRELRGISRGELAASTRIPLRSLERLEGGFFDDNVDGFVRGFVRTVAEALGLDPDDTISRMLSEPGAEQLTPLDLRGYLPGVVVGVVALVALALVIALVRFASPREVAPTLGVLDSDVVVRRDPVRSLAEAVAASSPPAQAEVPHVSAGSH
jgi:hypothetical protein